jgi:MSHA biogenesis protein MshP
MRLNHKSLNKNLLNPMRHMSDSHFSGAKQRGSMLVIAVFVIIVFSLLGLTLVKLLASSSDAVIHEVYGLRALNAARAGAEAQIALAFPITGAASCSDTAAFTFDNVLGLEQCQYDAICEQLAVIDGSINHVYYKFTSTGQCSVGDTIVSRTVYVDGLQ